MFFFKEESHLPLLRLCKTSAAVLALTFLSIGLVACNTMEGVGEDIESAGDGVEDAAD